MNAPSAKWNEVANLLNEARDALAPRRGDAAVLPAPTGPLTGTLDEFEEFLEHQEFELAWDALVAVADRAGASPACWGRLARAAGLMGLVTKQERALKRAVPDISGDRVLNIAQGDAERVYRDLLIYCICIALEPDGWHIDYELKNPRLRGGGPHYVIDAQTGAILSKRYEQ